MSLVLKVSERVTLMAVLLAVLVLAVFVRPGAAFAALADDLKACGLKAGPKSRVVSVVDGDTVMLKNGDEVRLVGIQAPKLPLGRKNFEAWPLADEAKEELTRLVLHKEARLFFGKGREDRHGRVLAHLVIEEDEIWAEGAMLRAGLARVYSFADNRFCVEKMLEQERLARLKRKAVWGDPYYKILPHYRTGSHLDTFQVVEGRVLDAAEMSSGVYLNFGDNWREDFTIFVAKRDLRRFDGGAAFLTGLEGQRIRTRGWLRLRNGPMIDVTHPEQLEALEALEVLDGALP